MNALFIIRHMMVAVLAATLFFAPSANAHRMKASVTKIDWKVKTNKMQVTHRVHFHDAQQILAGLTKDKNETLFTDMGIARMALYMDKDFDLKAAGKKVSFTPIGGEVEGDYLFIYLESIDAVLSQKLTIKSDIYRTHYPKQFNQVILERGEEEKSVILIKKGQVKAVEF